MRVSETPQFDGTYVFGEFRLDPLEKALFRNGKPVPLTPKVYQTLFVLVSEAGHLVEKDELMRRIWDDRFVEESNLTFNIKMLRKALGDDATRPRFIETVPRYGYRFVAEVQARAPRNAETNGVAQAVSENEPAARTGAGRGRGLIFAAASLVIVGILTIGTWYVWSVRGETGFSLLTTTFSSQRLSTNGKVFQALVSQDGNNVVYTSVTADEKQSVWLRQLDSGNNVEIIPPSGDIYFGLALSPDGNFLYFSRRPRNQGDQADIYRVSIFGGIPKKIISEAQGWMSISPGGEKISFVRCRYSDDEFCSLSLANSADGAGEVRLISRPRPIRIGANSISPDGNSIAFAVGQSENSANEFALGAVDIKSGVESMLSNERFFNIKGVAWLPGSRDLLITARRNSEQNFRIWHVSANSGEAVPVSKDSENYSVLSLDRAGARIAATSVKPEFRLGLYPIDTASTGRTIADARYPAFTPGGDIVFSSEMTGNSEIWSINRNGTEQRQLTSDPARDSDPFVAPDGGLIYFASNRNGAEQVFRMRADGTDQVQITHQEGGFPFFLSFDGEWLYYHSGVDRSLRRVSLKTGDEQSILALQKYRFAISPDGQTVAYSEKQGSKQLLAIALLTDGRIIRTFATADPNVQLLELAWLPDGNGILYVVTDREFEKNTVWLQKLDGGSPKLITDLGDEEISGFAVSPDGKSFAVTKGGWKHDAVLITGLK